MTSIPSPSLPLAAPPPVLRIAEADLTWALSEGWKDFKAKRGDILVLAFIYPLAGLLSAVVFMNDALLPLFFPLVAGLSVLGPAVASGFYEIARRRELGLSSSWRHFLDPVRGRSRSGLVTLSGMLIALFIAWLVAAYVIYSLTIGTGDPLTTGNLLQRVFMTPEGWAMIVVGNLVGLGFGILTIVLTLVSFPMVVDKPVDAMTAIGTSIRAVRANPAATASWGIRVVALLVLGTLPAFVGLAVVLPLLGYATWHLYTRMVER
ncbi:DUF2189 domain-containing protein [Brevundimonas variabilis]|uniref:Putative membrane protein n=1 Tax=Brevundimonas variabilis TaxID=74312 RepID=A0A7W9CI59_9CAUL|nr:DUF2189 domain-containing protein [Brevundimonas variabilis]MBB5746078.1 putative membrane protein [Brevundimonas variabilis]